MRHVFTLHLQLKLRLLLRTTLGLDEFSIEEASSAEEAAQVGRFWLPAVVILDVGLPGMDGLRFCRELKQNVRYLSQACSKFISVVPNAGLPILVDGKTCFPLQPEPLAALPQQFLWHDNDLVPRQRRANDGMRTGHIIGETITWHYLDAAAVLFEIGNSVCLE